MDESDGDGNNNHHKTTTKNTNNFHDRPTLLSVSTVDSSTPPTSYSSHSHGNNTSTVVGTTSSNRHSHNASLSIAVPSSSSSASTVNRSVSLVVDSSSSSTSKPQFTTHTRRPQSNPAKDTGIRLLSVSITNNNDNDDQNNKSDDDEGDGLGDSDNWSNSMDENEDHNELYEQIAAEEAKKVIQQAGLSKELSIENSVFSPRAAVVASSSSSLSTESIVSSASTSTDATAAYSALRTPVYIYRGRKADNKLKLDHVPDVSLDGIGYAGDDDDNDENKRSSSTSNNNAKKPGSSSSQKPTITGTVTTESTLKEKSTIVSRRKSSISTDKPGISSESKHDTNSTPKKNPSSSSSTTVPTASSSVAKPKLISQPSLKDRRITRIRQRSSDHLELTEQLSNLTINISNSNLQNTHHTSSSNVSGGSSSTSTALQHNPPLGGSSNLHGWESQIQWYDTEDTIASPHHAEHLLKTLDMDEVYQEAIPLDTNNNNDDDDRNNVETPKILTDNGIVSASNNGYINSIHNDNDDYEKRIMYQVPDDVLLENFDNDDGFGEGTFRSRQEENQFLDTIYSTNSNGDKDTLTDENGTLLQSSSTTHRRPLMRLNSSTNSLNRNDSWHISNNGTLRLGDFLVINASGIKEWGNLPPSASVPMNHTNYSVSQRNTATTSHGLNASSFSSSGGVSSTTNRGHIKSELLMLDMLGRGSSGVVQRALHLPSLQLVAVKHVRIYEAEVRQAVIRELQSLYANMTPLVPRIRLSDTQQLSLSSSSSLSLASALHPLAIHHRNISTESNISTNLPYNHGPNNDNNDPVFLSTPITPLPLPIDGTTMGSGEISLANTQSSASLSLSGKLSIGDGGGGVGGTGSIVPLDGTYMHPHISQSLLMNASLGKTATLSQDGTYSKSLTMPDEQDYDMYLQQQQRSSTTATAASPYVVRLYDAFANTQAGTVSIVMEYCAGGSLQDVVDAGGCRDEGVLARIAAHSLRGLAFLHEHHLLHRDIKPGNILVSTLRGDSYKIADMGISRQMDDSTQAYAKTFVGTMVYMSPERLGSSPNGYGYPSDIWSLGLSILSIALGRYPYADTSYWELLKHIKDLEPPLHLLDEIGDTARKYAEEGYVNIVTMMEEDPNRTVNQNEYDRLLQEAEKARTIVAHFPSPEFRDFLRLSLLKDPQVRPTAVDLLQHPFIQQFAKDNLPTNVSASLHSTANTVMPSINEEETKESWNEQRSNSNTPLYLTKSSSSGTFPTNTDTLLTTGLYSIIGKPLCETYDNINCAPLPGTFAKLSIDEQDALLAALHSILNAIVDTAWVLFIRYFRRYRNRRRRKWNYSLEDTSFVIPANNVGSNNFVSTANTLGTTATPSPFSTTGMMMGMGSSAGNNPPTNLFPEEPYAVPSSSSVAAALSVHPSKGLPVTSSMAHLHHPHNSSSLANTATVSSSHGPTKPTDAHTHITHPSRLSSSQRFSSQGNSTSGGSVFSSSSVPSYRELQLDLDDVRMLAMQLGLPPLLVRTIINEKINEKITLMKNEEIQTLMKEKQSKFEQDTKISAEEDRT